jgi:hypothetical protein
VISTAKVSGVEWHGENITELWKGAAVAYLKILSLHSYAEIEENCHQVTMTGHSAAV